MPKKRKRLIDKKLALGAVAAVAVIGASSALFHHYHHSVPAAPPGVNLSPATAQEKQESAQSKDNIVQQQSQTSGNSSSKKQATVVITDASSSSVKAYVTGVFEDGGSCTATFTQGGTVITRTSTAFANVSYTQCPPITPDLPNSNPWSLVVSYSSAAAQGTSPSQTL